VGAGRGAAGLQELVSERLEAIPVRDAATMQDYRLWVQEFTLRALLLGSYAEIYTLHDDEWGALLSAVHSFGEPTGPMPQRVFVDDALDCDPYSEPSRPFLDAALNIVTTEGFQALTLDAVAKRSGRSSSFMLSAFGSIEAFWRDVLTVAFEDGFDGLVPLRFDMSKQSVEQSIAMFLNSRQYAAAHRVLALTGISINAEQRAHFVGSHTRDRANLPAMTEDPDQWLLPLALDGWHLMSAMYGSSEVEGLAPPVRARLLDLAGT
jgi:hypothetical protein